MFMAFRHYLQLLYWLRDRDMSRNRRWQSRSAFISPASSWTISIMRSCALQDEESISWAGTLSLCIFWCMRRWCIHNFAEQLTAQRPNSKPILSFFYNSLSLCPADLISCWNPMGSTVWMKMGRSWPSKTSISLMKEITSASLETRPERIERKSHSACLVSERILSLPLKLNWKQVYIRVTIKMFSSLGPYNKSI